MAIQIKVSLQFEVVQMRRAIEVPTDWNYAGASEIKRDTIEGEEGLMRYR